MVQLDQVTVTVNGQEFVIDLVPGARGLRADAILPIQSDKVWWQYRVILSDSSTNPLGETHTFTATVQRTNDGGTTWLPVPDGAFLDHVWVDPNGGEHRRPRFNVSHLTRNCRRHLHLRRFVHRSDDRHARGQRYP